MVTPTPAPSHRLPDLRRETPGTAKKLSLPALTSSVANNSEGNTLTVIDLNTHRVLCLAYSTKVLGPPQHLDQVETPRAGAAQPRGTAQEGGFSNLRGGGPLPSPTIPTPQDPGGCLSNCQRPCNQGGPRTCEKFCLTSV